MENFGSWSIITTNFLIILYLALGGVTLASVLHLVNGKWRFQIRDLSCSLAVLFPIAGVLLVVLLVFGQHTFPWLAHAHGDPEHHLPGWHNYTFLVTRQVLGFLFVWWIYSKFIKLQKLSETDSSYPAQRRYRNIALLLPFVYFIYGTVVAWDFEMTMIPGWHSASYGAYHFQSNFHMFLGFFTIFIYFLYNSGKLTKPFQEYIFNYMAQFMLAMTILWTYLYFTQYLIMWYGRLPGEMGRFDAMMTGYPTLWWTFLTLKFIIPFTTLAITPNRHYPPVIVFVAACIVLGTWIERYTWISGSVDQQYYHMPMTSISDILVTAVLLGIGGFFVRKALIKQALIKA